MGSDAQLNLKHITVDGSDLARGLSMDSIDSATRSLSLYNIELNGDISGATFRLTLYQVSFANHPIQTLNRKLLLLSVLVIDLVLGRLPLVIISRRENDLMPFTIEGKQRRMH